MAAVIDHLWQSAWFTALVWLLAWMLREHSASLRLWLWRAAALKFALPFYLLYEIGRWLGFPVRHSAIAPPEAVVRTVDAVMPIAAPAQSVTAGTVVLGIGLAASLLLLIACSRLIWRQFRRMQRLARREQLLIDADWNARPAPPGFLKTMALAGSALVLVVAPVVGGALRDRQHRQQALQIDTAALRTAQITLRETAWRFGDHPEIVATADGVTIRKTNLQDLVAMVYGIGQFEVFGGAMPWLESPHYEVQVRGAIHAPAEFDPYSLRQPVTNYLYEQFGVSIRVNGSCQEPCKDYQSFVIERLPRCTRPLSPDPGCI